jgi:5-methylcytosine-specific restriction enzyme A
MKQTKRDKLLIASRSNKSSEWSRLEKRFKSNFDECAACGKKRGLVVHHIKPVFLFPSLELDVSNLITLCTAEANCHLAWGHLGDFKSYNENVVADAAWYRKRVKNRPKWK